VILQLEILQQAHSADLDRVTVDIAADDHLQIVLVGDIFQELEGLLISGIIEFVELLIVSHDSVAISDVALTQRAVTPLFHDDLAPVLHNILPAIAVNYQSLNLRAMDDAGHAEKQTESRQSCSHKFVPSLVHSTGQFSHL
jgi:hypothetical protein